MTDNLKQEEHAIVQVEEMQAVNAVLYGKYTMEGDQFEKIEVDFGRSTKNNITQGSGRSGQNRIVTRSILHMILTSTATRPAVL
ncbi:major capsid protein [Actinomadura kijaniata]